MHSSFGLFKCFAHSSDALAGQETKESCTKVLIIEDDRDLNNLLKFTLESTHNYKVVSFFDGNNALENILAIAPDLLILDVMLPGRTGTEILRDVRATASLSGIPVVLLTAKSQESDKVDGFEAGADDYITKPFSPRELLLRVTALLRRTQQLKDVSFSSAPAVVAQPNRAPDKLTLSEEKFMRIANLAIYPELFRVTVDDEPVALTSTEYQLLLYLVQRQDRLQSRDSLLQKVWGYEGTLNTRTVDTHVKRLRQKLGSAGQLIETVHGFGYQLTENSIKKNRPVNRSDLLEEFLA